MAFMMPVVKNDWDIYKPNRSRRVSECSNHNSRSRKVSECRSEGPSLSTSPGSEFVTSPTRSSVPTNMSSRPYSRASSRASESSLQSPIKSVSTGSSPPKTGSDSHLNKFHNRLLDKLKKSLRSNSESEKTSS